MKWVNRLEVRFLNRNAWRIIGWKSGSRTRLFSSLIVGSSWSEFRLEWDKDEGWDGEGDDNFKQSIFQTFGGDQRVDRWGKLSLWGLLPKLELALYTWRILWRPQMFLLSSCALSPRCTFNLLVVCVVFDHLSPCRSLYCLRVSPSFEKDDSGSHDASEIG